MATDQRILDESTCRYCHQPIIRGLLQSGYHRSFMTELQPTSQVAEHDRYAVHRRLRCVVDLIAVAHPPSKVLVPHYCQEYAEAVRMRGMSGLGDAIEEVFGAKKPTKPATP
jgi:hypothetical protein